MKAKISISRDSNNKINIEIKDKASGLPVTKFSMAPHDFAMAISGLSAQLAEFEFTPTEFTVKNIGKERETADFWVDKSGGFGKDEQKKIVKDEFHKQGLANDGWMIFHDGTNSQQLTSKHRATLYRFV